MYVTVDKREKISVKSGQLVKIVELNQVRLCYLGFSYETS